MKGHQNNPQSQRILSRRDHAPGFEMDGSDSVLYLKATDLQKCINHKGVETRFLRWGGGMGCVCGESSPHNFMNMCKKWKIVLHMLYI